jgi:hypothetical protein
MDQPRDGDGPLGRVLLPGLVYKPALAGAVVGLCALAWTGLVALFLGLALFQSLGWTRFYLILGGAALVAVIRFLSYLFVEGRIDACEQGLIFRAGQAAARHLRYDEVAEIATARPPALSSGDSLCGARLVADDGFQLALGAVEEQSLEALRPVVLERVARLVGERMLREIGAQRTVTLNGVEVGPHGIEAAGTRLAWQEIEYGTFRKDGLRIVARPPAAPLVLPFGTPNLHPLLHVLREMRAKVRPGSAAEDAGRADAFAFLPAARPRVATDRPARRKPPRVPGYPQDDPEFGEAVLGSPRKSALIVVLFLALAVVGGVGPPLILLGVFPPWAWIPVGIATLVLAMNALEPAKRGLAVYERGVVQGRKRLPWSEVVRLYLELKNVYVVGSNQGPSRESRLQIESYRTWLFINLSGEEGQELSLRVLQATLPQLVERHHDSLVKWGGSVTVKGVTLTRDALLREGREHALADIRKPKLREGRFTCQTRGKSKETIELAASDWNFGVFYSLFTLLWADARKPGDVEE